MVDNVNNNTQSQYGIPANSTDFVRMTATTAADEFIITKPNGEPAVDPQKAAEFAALPVEQQVALLQRWLEAAKASPNPELKLAVLTLVAKLGNAETVPAVQGLFDSVAAQLDRLSPADRPVGLVTPAIRHATERLHAGSASEADYELLSTQPGVASLSPADRHTVASKYANAGNENRVREIIKGAPNIENAHVALALFSAPIDQREFDNDWGGAYRGWQVLNVMLHPGADYSDDPHNNLMRTNRELAGLPHAGTDPVTRRVQEELGIAATVPPSAATTEAPATQGTAAAGDTAAAATDTTIERMSDLERKTAYEKAYNAAWNDGQLGYEEMLTLMTTAIDPEGYIQRFRDGDPELFMKLKNNDGDLSMIKDRMAQRNFIRDTMLAIQDDEINRRKKLADSLSKV